MSSQFCTTMSSEEEGEISIPTETHSKILKRQEYERTEFKKRAERIRSSIPRRDRAGRARAAEDAAEEEKRLLKNQATERLENGIAEDSVPSNVTQPDAQISVSVPSSNNDRRESKAARRRRKKAEQEANSQRRIDAEKAGMGPSPKFVETQAIEAQLKPKNMRIHPVAADGHCLYNAIAHQMLLTKFQSTVPASVEGLRNATADYLMAHKTEYIPFLEDVNGDDDEFIKYCEELRNEAVWGGQVELKILTEILVAEIEVYAANMPVVRMGQSKNPEEVLRVSFHRQYYGLGEHYNSIVPQS